MKNSPKIIGFLQALGLVSYVVLFVLIARIGIELLKSRFDTTPEEPFIPMILFLLAFVTSALICGIITFGYPTYLFLNGRKEVALPAVLWTAIWLVVLFAAGSVLIIFLI